MLLRMSTKMPHHLFHFFKRYSLFTAIHHNISVWVSLILHHMSKSIHFRVLCFLFFFYIFYVFAQEYAHIYVYFTCGKTEPVYLFNHPQKKRRKYQILDKPLNLYLFSLRFCLFLTSFHYMLCLFSFFGIIFDYQIYFFECDGKSKR